MKKKISIALVLTMVLSMFSGFTYAETEHPARAIGREIKENRLVQSILSLSYNTKFDLAFIIYSLKDKQSTIIDGLFNAIGESEDLSTRLSENGVTKDVANTILDKINAEVNEIGIPALKDLLKKDITWDTVIKPNVTVGSKIEDVYDRLLANEKISEMNNKVNTKLQAGKTKVGFVLELVNELVDYGRLTRTITDTNTKGTYSFEITNRENMVEKIQSIVGRYFDGVTIPSNMEDVIGYLENKFDGIFKDTVYLTADDKLTIFNAVKSVNPTSAKLDDQRTSETPPSGGGTTTPSETPPEGEEPKVEDGKVKIELGKDAVEVKTGDKGQSVVAVKSENVKAAVEELVKAVKETPTAKPVVTIKLDDVKTAAMEVSVPKDAMTQLIENNVELVIESKSLSYEIPAEALRIALEGIAEDAQIEFNSEIVPVEEAEQLFTDEHAAKTAKVIQFSISIKDKDGKEIDKVEKFGAKIKISIEIEREDGNPDLLAVFYINEKTGTLEFVGGKIKDNKIIMTTDHYSKFAVIEYDKSFDDIENHWSKDYVKSMVAKHVIDGFEDGTYRPEDKLTRAQFAKLLVEALELDMAVDKGNFEDVGAGHWAKDYIETARQQGIIQGYGDGTFKPEQFINRSEMATTITNALKLDKNISSTVLGQFRDSLEIPSWAVEYVVPVVAEGLLVGSDGILNPLGNVTRAEAATVIYRIYNR
ncbi:MAG: S-layer homology domain-containing protein [Candidatus Alkaliphilus sp. MAG34]